MKTKTALLLCIIIPALFGFVAAPGNKGNLPFSINYKTPLVVKSQETYDKYNYTEYAAGDDIIQLKTYINYSKENAKKLIDDRKFFLDLSFKDQVSPYPGVLTATIGCPDDQRPKPQVDTALARLDCKLLATSNFVYGNCNLSDNFYHSLYCIFYCPDKREAFELKIYTPISKPTFDYEALKASIKCN